MILLSVKSADPTAIDFRSPDISPPPSGLELPQAAEIDVIRASRAARIARFHFRVLDIDADIPKPSRPLDISRTLSICTR